MRGVGLLLLGLPLAGCLFDPSLPSGLVVRCEDDDDCQSPQVCDVGFCAGADVVAPGQIVDLAVDLAATTDDSFTVTFTAPGDDGNGTGAGPRRYRVTATAQGVADAPRVVDVAATAAAREREVIRVDALQGGTVYAVVVEAIDDAGLSTVSASLLVETGGALCARDAVTGTRTARVAQLTITRPEHLVRLYGCEVIDGSVQIVDAGCEITQLAALQTLREVTGALVVTGNALCGRGLVDLTDLAALERVARLTVENTGVLADLQLNAVIGAASVVANQQLRRVQLDAARGPDELELVVSDNPALEDVVVAVPGGSVHVRDNPALTTITLPNLASGRVELTGMPQLEDVALPQWRGSSATVDGVLVLDDLPLLPALQAPVLERLQELRLHETGIDDPSAEFAALTRVGRLEVDDDDVAACDVFAFAARVATPGEEVSVPRVDADGDGVIDVDQRSCDPVLAMPVCSSLLPEHAAACGELRAVSGDDLDVGQQDLRAPNLRTVVGSLRISPADPSAFPSAFPSLTVVDLPMLTTAEDVLISNNRSLTTLRLPRLVSVSFLNVSDNDALSTLELAVLTSATGVFIGQNTALTTVRLPELAAAGEVFGVVVRDNPALQTVHLDALRHVGADVTMFRNRSLAVLGLPALTTVGGSVSVELCDVLAAVELPALQQVSASLQVTSNTALTTVSLGALQQVGSLSIQLNGALTRVSLGALQQVEGSCSVRENPRLCRSTTAAISDGLCVVGELDDAC